MPLLRSPLVMYQRGKGGKKKEGGMGPVPLHSLRGNRHNLIIEIFFRSCLLAEKGFFLGGPRGEEEGKKERCKKQIPAQCRTVKKEGERK